MKMLRLALLGWVAALIGVVPGTASAVDFKSPDSPLEITWTTDLTAGGGVRLRSPSCSLIGDPTFRSACGGNVNTAQWANGDDGDLNYKKGQLISSFLGLTSELVMNWPERELKFVARGSALVDSSADNTQRTPLSDDAKRQIVRNARVQDLFVDKSFATNAGHVRLRAGNQVINWGEAQFLPYGVNQTNAMDWMIAAVPGQSLKQIIVPAPMLSVLADLRDDLSIEAYYQFRWNKNIFAPVGSYWSASDAMGRANAYRQSTTSNANLNLSGLDAAALARLHGMDPSNPAVYEQAQRDVLAGNYAATVPGSYGSAVNDMDQEPKHSRQYGVRLSYRPDGSDVKYGFYYMRYTDKTPVWSANYSTFAYDLNYRKNRDLYGVSANWSSGDWLFGGELAYRPRDAVALTSCFGSPSQPLDFDTNGFTGTSGSCAFGKDNKRFQLTVNAQINLTRSNFAPVGWLGADTGYFMVESAWVNYPGVKAGKPYNSTIDGVGATQYVYAGGSWYEPDANGKLITKSMGTRDSIGAAIYASLSYDGSVIPGWIVTPAIYHQQGLYGYSPGATNALWMQGSKATTLSLTLTKNPATWTAGLNYVKYWGGSDTINPYKDRDMLGFYAKYTF